jgi:hypothetical protein
MSYKVIVSPDAFDGLRQMESGTLLKMLPCISSSLEQLAEDPVRLGERPLIPYPGGGQVFYFQCRVDGINYRLAALYCYEETETEIRILSVRYQRIIM